MSPKPNPLTRGKKQKALALLRQNLFAEAKPLLEQICNTDRRDVEAWHLLGAVNHNLGKPEEAASCCRRAITLQPDHVEAHYALGLICQEQENLEDALNHYRQALVIRPDFLEALCNLGSALEKLGRHVEALDCYRHALRLNPGLPELHYNLGNALQALARHEEAEQSYREAIRLRPSYVEAYDHLGVVLAKQDKYEEAVVHYRQALAIRPDHAASHYNLAMSLKRLGQLDEAVASYRRALSTDPHDTDALVNLGVALAEQHKFDEAITYYREALRLKPDHAETYNNLGVALNDLQKFDEAIPYYREALHLKSDYSEAYSNLGNALRGLGRLDEAIASHHQALASSPNYADAHFNLALVLLLQGDFRNSWQGYQQRWGRKASAGRPLSPSPWDGSNLNRKNIFLHTEQGLGDEFFFLRFVPWLKQRGAGKVTYRSDPRIASLLSRVEQINRIAAPNEQPVAEELVFAVGDLPCLLGMQRIDQIPPSLTLTSLPQHIESLKAWLARLGPPPYVGVTWRAGVAAKRGLLYKELSLLHLAEALREIPATVLVLQRNPQPGEIEAFTQALGRPAHDLSALNEDLEQMLALLSLIDDYMGVSNTNMHLRAAVGRGARTLVPAPPEWRWMAEGKESPWFPGFTVYRQRYDGSWGEALAALRQNLIEAFAG